MSVFLLAQLPVPGIPQGMVRQQFHAPAVFQGAVKHTQVVKMGFLRINRFFSEYIL